MFLKTLSRLLLAISVLSVPVSFPANATGQEGSPAIEQLTENVGIGLIARDLAKFNEEFSALCKEAQIPLAQDDLANLFYHPLEECGLPVDDVVNRQGSGGLVLIGTELNNPVLRFIYPVKESIPIAEALGIDQLELQAGSAYRTDDGDVVMLDGKVSIGVRFFGGPRTADGTPEPIENPFGEVGSVAKYLSADDHQMFGKSDAVLMLENAVSRMFWQQVLSPMFGTASADSDLWDRLSKAGDEIRFGLAAIDMDEGVHVRSKSFFTENDGAAIQLIKDIRGGDSPSNLNHLPDAQMLMAGAAKGNGEQNASLAKAIVKLIVEIASPNEEVLTGADKETFYDSFEAIWKKLNGTRVGLYRNEGEAGDGGELALVAIYDVEDPAALLESLPGLVKFANDGVQKTTPEGEEPGISFEYNAGAEQFSGAAAPADVLTFDTSRMPKESSETLHRFFGKNANQLRFVPMENHVVMFVGTNPAILNATIENLKSKSAGLAAHPAVVAAGPRLDPRRKIEVHFSAKNLNYIYSAMIRKRKDLGRYVRPEEITSFALVIEEDRFGFDFWIPMKELDRATKLIMANF